MTRSSVTIQIANESATERLGAALADGLPRQCVVALDGTLGAGKTRLVRAVAVASGVAAENVTSPTFTLWQTYHGHRTIHHLDAYRIQDEDEFDALGVQECFDTEAVVFVEWANRIARCLPSCGRLDISIDVISDCERAITLASEDATLSALLDDISRDFD